MFLLQLAGRNFYYTQPESFCLIGISLFPTPRLSRGFLFTKSPREKSSRGLFWRFNLTLKTALYKLYIVLRFGNSRLVNLCTGSIGYYRGVSVIPIIRDSVRPACRNRILAPGNSHIKISGGITACVDNNRVAPPWRIEGLTNGRQFFIYKRREPLWHAPAVYNLTVLSAFLQGEKNGLGAATECAKPFFLQVFYKHYIFFIIP